MWSLGSWPSSWQRSALMWRHINWSGRFEVPYIDSTIKQSICFLMLVNVNYGTCWNGPSCFCLWCCWLIAAIQMLFHRNVTTGLPHSPPLLIMNINEDIKLNILTIQNIRDWKRKKEKSSIKIVETWQNHRWEFLLSAEEDEGRWRKLKERDKHWGRERWNVSCEEDRGVYGLTLLSWIWTKFSLKKTCHVIGCSLINCSLNSLYPISQANRVHMNDTEPSQWAHWQL